MLISSKEPLHKNRQNNSGPSTWHCGPADLTHKVNHPRQCPGYTGIGLVVGCPRVSKGSLQAALMTEGAGDVQGSQAGAGAMQALFYLAG